MLTLEELKRKPEILQHINWELNPQEAFQFSCARDIGIVAFEAYQVKSVGSWKHRHLPEVFHFYLDLWKGEAKVFLMRRSLKSAEDVAEIPVPSEMVASCLKQHVGKREVRGQYPIDDSIRDWIRSQLGQ